MQDIFKNYGGKLALASIGVLVAVTIAMTVENGAQERVPDADADATDESRSAAPHAMSVMELQFNDAGERMLVDQRDYTKRAASAIVTVDQHEALCAKWVGRHGRAARANGVKWLVLKANLGKEDVICEV